MRYAVVYEKGNNGYGAYVPDLPGCVAAGTTLEETTTLIREAIELHLQGMRDDGELIPEASTITDYITVAL
jgi:predicted RNase H-like HicB family nuclease